MNTRPWPHLYRVLDVHHEAAAEEIESAVVDRLAEVRGDPAGRRVVAEAWAVLVDPEQRAAYDRAATSRASLADRELAAAVRPLAVWLGFFTLGALFFVFIGARDVGSIIGAGVLVACAPAGWRVLGSPLGWLELDLIRGAWVLRGILATATGPFVAPFVIGWPLLRGLIAHWPALATSAHLRGRPAARETSR